MLATLVRFGAPSRILLDGKPHLGTDNLVRLLQGFRKELIALGGEYRWSSRVERLIRSEDGGRVVGVGLADGSEERGEAVVLAAGHSARELYAELVAQGATLDPRSSRWASASSTRRRLSTRRSMAMSSPRTPTRRGAATGCRRRATGWRSGRRTPRRASAAATRSACARAARWCRPRSKRGGSASTACRSRTGRRGGPTRPSS